MKIEIETSQSLHRRDGQASLDRMAPFALRFASILMAVLCGCGSLCWAYAAAAGPGDVPTGKAATYLFVFLLAGASFIGSFAASKRPNLQLALILFFLGLFLIGSFAPSSQPL